MEGLCRTARNPKLASLSTYFILRCAIGMDIRKSKNGVFLFPMDSLLS